MKKEILIFCYLHFFLKKRLIYSIKRQIINIHRNNTENKRLSTLWKVFDDDDDMEISHDWK